MPGSSLLSWQRILLFLYEIAPSSVVDVGPGYGVGAALIGAHVGRRDFPVEALRGPIEYIDAVEIEPTYVTDRLKALYRKVVIADALNLQEPFWSAYDAVLMSEVIEHMPKDRALELLGRMQGWIIITTPAAFFEQGGESSGLPESERHVSAWSQEDFAATGRCVYYENAEGGQWVLLRPIYPHGGVRDVYAFWDQIARTSQIRKAISPVAAGDYSESGRSAAARVIAAAAPQRYPIVLELGSGDGGVTEHLAAAYTRVIACDISPAMIGKVAARRLPNVDCVQTNGLKFPYGTHADLVYSESVFLHNLHDDVRRIFASLRGVVDQGAPFLFELPCYAESREPTGPTDVGVWTRNELEDALIAAGWKPLLIQENPGVFSFDALGPRHGALHGAIAT